MRREQPSATSRGNDLASRYDVLGRLAIGGMAELFVGRPKGDPNAGVVVIKRILPQLAEDPEFVRMFRDEAYLASTLDHPNIVRVFDVGLDDDEPFFTMEYVHGENLRTIIRGAQARSEGIPLDVVLGVALGVTASLHYAHERTDANGRPLMIVHRDVSPTNVLVSQDGEVKIVDFGIAKAAAGTHVTQAGMLKGKASYMSPEQCRAENVDRRSDVFAIGILLYELTTLQRLFRGENELTILHQILTGNIPPPSTIVPTFPRELEAILMRSLQVDPAQRYSTAAAMQQDLEAFVARHGVRPSREGMSRYLIERFGAKPVPWAGQQGAARPPDDAATAATPSASAPADRARPAPPQPTRPNTAAQGVRPAAAPRAANAGVAPKRPPTGAAPAAREPARMPARPIAAAAPPAQADAPVPRDPRAPTAAVPRGTANPSPPPPAIVTPPRPTAPPPQARPREATPARPAVPIATASAPPSRPGPAATAPPPARPMTAEQAAFLRGEPPPGVAFTAGTHDPSAVRTEIAPAARGEMAAPSLPQFDDSQAHTMIAPPSAGASGQTMFAPPPSPGAPPPAGPTPSPARTMFAPPPSPAGSRTRTAPPTPPSSEHTMIAPPAGPSSEHTMIAPPAGPSSEHTMIAPPAGPRSTGTAPPQHTAVAPAPTGPAGVRMPAGPRTMIPIGAPPPAPTPAPPAAPTPTGAGQTVFLGGDAPPPREDRTMLASLDPVDSVDATMITPAQRSSTMPPSGVDRTMIANLDAAAMAALAARPAPAPSGPTQPTPARSSSTAPAAPAAPPPSASFTGTQPMRIEPRGDITGITNVGLDPPKRRGWVLPVVLVVVLGGLAGAGFVAWPRFAAWRAASASVDTPAVTVDDAKVDDAKVDDAKVDDAKVDDAKVDDAKVDDANADDAKVDDAKADDAAPVADATPTDTAPVDDAKAGDTAPPDANPVEPEPAQPVEPEPAKPVEPEPAKPEPAKPEPAKPEPAKPKPAKPKPAKPKPAKPKPEPKPKPKPKPKPGPTIPGFGNGPLVPP